MAANLSYHLYGLDSVDYEKEKVEKFVPTLFIGLGGSGKEILQRFRKNLFEQYVNWREDFARFLLIDTDDQPTGSEYEQVAFRRERGEFIGCGISQKDYNNAIQDFRKRFDRRFADWLHPDFESLVPPTAVQNGAGTYRQAGRLAFFLNFPSIKDQIHQHMKSALHFAAQRPQTLFGQPGEVAADRIEVVIVTSLAGGTGSGMFLDTAYLVRDLMDKEPNFARITLHTTLMALMPNAFTNVSPTLSKRFQQNAYAALLEIEHFSTPRPADPFGRKVAGTTGRLDRPAFLVNWSDPTGSLTEIATRPWDTCYLIDDAHDAQRTLKTSTEDIYQLVADYLFLDFGNNPFAIAKRSARSNHTQLTDRTLGMQVLRQPPSGSGATSPTDRQKQQMPVVVYENYYGCTFSSFGLSEIQIDAERVVRAAGYRLASRLIRERWLGEVKNVTTADFKRMIGEDLRGEVLPRGVTNAIDFNRDSLFEQLVTHPEKQLKSAVHDEFQSLRKINSTSQMRSMIESTMNRLRKSVLAGRDRDGGSDYLLMSAKARALQGVLPDLGPLCKRLKLLVRERCEHQGIAVTQRIVEGLYDELDKAAKGAREDSARAGNADDDVMYRLENASMVPWPCKSIAMNIEFRRAVPHAEEIAWGQYRKTAWGLLERLYASLRDYAGSSKLLEHPTGATLWRNCQTQSEFLQRVAELLKTRFTDVAVVSGTDRKQSMIPDPGENGENYDEMIQSALRMHPSVGSDPSDQGQSAVGFDWLRAEQAILDQIPTQEHGSGGLTRMDLIEAYERDYRGNRDKLPAIVEMLAQACAQILRPHVKLDNFGGGNVVNYLKSTETGPRNKKLTTFVASSGPRLPMAGAATRSLERFRPAWRTILGCTPSDDLSGQEKASDIEKQVQSIVESEKTGDPAQNKVHEVKTMLESKLVLVRELAGVPLHVYDRLKQLGQAYFDPAISQQRMTAHLRYNEGFEELPDIEEIEAKDYDAIQRNVINIIRGILLEFLNYQEGSRRFVVELTDSRRSSVTRVNLGSRLPRVLQHASTKAQVVEFVNQQWQEWFDKVAKRQPGYLALHYCAIQMTLQEFPSEVEFRSEATSLPLQTCLEELLVETELLLKSNPDGQRLFDQLRRRNEMDHDYREWRVWHPKLCQNLRDQKGLRRLGDELPFWTLNWRYLTEKPALDLDALGFNFPVSSML